MSPVSKYKPPLRLGARGGEAELMLVVAADDSDSDDSMSTLGRELMAVEPVNHFLKAMAVMKIFS